MQEILKIMKGLPLMEGLEIKAISKVKGHEGEDCYYGNLYLNGKRLGKLNEDSYGGPFFMDIDESKQELFDEIQAYVDENKFTSAVSGDGTTIVLSVQGYLWSVLRCAGVYSDVKKYKKTRVYIYAKGTYEGGNRRPDYLTWFTVPANKETIKEIEENHLQENETVLSKYI